MYLLQAHRLKNADTATTQALASLATRRRILLSGTPMQNDLEEFYAMVDFTNPGVLGTASSFRRTYMHPIISGREPDASDKEKELADTRASELSSLVNEFILRRTNALLSAHLPPKLVQIVFCKLTALQVWGLGSLLWVESGICSSYTCDHAAD
jgi:DNA repair and recombination RAD54-like protein